MSSLSESEKDKVESFLQKLSKLLGEFYESYGSTGNFLGLLELPIVDEKGNLSGIININVSEQHMNVGSMMRLLEYAKNNLISEIQNKINLAEIQKKINNGLWVICIDDCNKPSTFDEGFDWVKKGEIYKVESFFHDIIKDGALGFILKDMNTPPHFGGYSMTRFLEYDKEKLN